MSRQTPVLGPTGATDRALAPDLARGFMLLFIALANTVWYLWAAPSDGPTMHPAPEGGLDSVAQFFTIMAVDMRSYPMFAFLFGYGMMQLARRQEAAGADVRSVNALLRRRNLWLVVFGFVHALLLWMGDILGAYGVAGLVLGWLFFRRKDVTLIVWGAVLTALMTLGSALSLLALPFVSESDGGAGGFDISEMAGNIGDPSIASAAVDRVANWPLVSVGQGLLGLVVPTAILLGFWAARRRFLEEPGQNLRTLRRVAVVGIAVGWIGGLPEALNQVGVWDLNADQGLMLSFPHMLTGLFGGLGYVALIALVAHRLQERGRTGGVVVTALTATGRRSLSAYLAQSVLCAPVLAAWGLGLAAYLTSWTMFLYAVAVWLVTVAGAYAMERAGRRGPAEVLLRKLSYRRSTKAAAEPSGPPRADEHQERTSA
ncbi:MULTISPECIES: DUF418 domain-containing protein [Nocardiopsis]|uniref:DUF418 domain-containing protein n=1 Tax=Nocardiopsis TaxID=2013 RepID=UPI000345CC6E|nr:MULTISPECIES: DUF418 domain-containing protein [Nocardiopsis]PWV46339.1 putative membrane protein YeiB [Nocardiopsis sp. L17-MgMaSL7]